MSIDVYVILCIYLNMGYDIVLCRVYFKELDLDVWLRFKDRFEIIYTEWSFGSGLDLGLEQSEQYSKSKIILIPEDLLLQSMEFIT